MKFLGFDISKAAALPTLDSAALGNDPPTGARGVDGSSFSSVYAGMLAGGPDTNPDLMGRLKYQAFYEMKTTDGACRSLSWMVKLPIRSAETTIIPAKHDPDGEAAARARADWLAWQFGLERFNGQGRLDLTWDELNEQDLLFLDYGAQGGELVWAKPEVWVDADGDEHVVRPLDRLAPRSAASVYQIKVNPQTGLIDEIRQDLPNAQPIPGNKLYWISNEREGDNLWGVSLLRSAYGPWFIKKNLMVGSAIGYDRFMSGVPWISHPPGKQREAQQMGEGFTVHEHGYITTEGDAETGTSDWMIRILKAADSIADPVGFLRYLDAQIAKSGLEQAFDLGNTPNGGRAVGEVLSDPFYLAVQSFARKLCEVRMRRVVRKLWDRNFGLHVPIPEITMSKIQGRNVAVLARALSDLSSAGLNFADRDTQNDVRDILDLRHLPEAARNAITNLPEDVGVTVSPGATVPTEGGPVRGTPTGIVG